MKSKDIFLSAEERYQVWCIKRAEKPDLLEVYDENRQLSNINEGDINSKERLVAPLTDGCDIPAWRNHGFAMSCNASQDRMPQMLEAVLGVGSGCPLLRRESQLPVSSTLSQNTTTKWHKLQRTLFEEPLPLLGGEDDGKSCCCINLVRLQPKEYDYEKDIKPLYPETGRTWRDPPPPFEKENIPALIRGCTDRGWPGMETLTWKSLLQRFGHDETEWRFSDVHGHGMTLHAYNKYCHSIEGLTDDAPLAIYDSQFHPADDPRSSMVQDFVVPTCFQYDLFAGLTEEEINPDGESVGVRPPYQWILMGPERSGTGLHVDPIGTHAWVTLIEGCKRWILFPPDTPAQVIGFSKSKQVPSVVWFEQWWCGGKIQQSLPNCNNNNQQQQTLQFVEFLQNPGETIYVPAGWPHLVLNLKASVAITQNYATEYPHFDRFWKAVEAEGTILQIQRLQEFLQKNRLDLTIPSRARKENDKILLSSAETASTEEEGDSEDD